MRMRIGIPGEGDLLFIATTGSWRPDAESAREHGIWASDHYGLAVDVEIGRNT